jgi:hypothetical protein
MLLPVATLQPLERDLQPLQPLGLSREPAHLGRATPPTIDAKALRPHRLAINACRLQLGHWPCWSIPTSFALDS